jgi:hypothetical protein
MDKEHAKFILQSFRPDGADANNLDFTEALQLVAEDRELGLWLAEERAHDAMFAEALMAVDIPDGLRDEIFSVMEHDGGGKDLSSELDALFVGAMANVSPPEGLRDQIISAMKVERESAEKPDSTKVVRFPMRWLNVAAIAAVLVLSAIFIYPEFRSSSNEQLALHEVQVDIGNFLSVSHEMEISENTLAGVNTWLAQEGLPEAETIPQGLITVAVKGGRKFVLDNGVSASLIFFEKKDAGEFYLMVLKVSSLEDAEKLLSIGQIGLKNCWDCPATHCRVTAWKDDNKAYLLLSKSESKTMAELF